MKELTSSEVGGSVGAVCVEQVSKYYTYLHLLQHHLPSSSVVAVRGIDVYGPRPMAVCAATEHR